MNSYFSTVKREFQEHFGAFVLLPLSLAGLLMVALFYATIKLPVNNLLFSFDETEISANGNAEQNESANSTTDYIIDFKTGAITAADDTSKTDTHSLNISNAITTTLFGIQILFVSLSGFVAVYYLLYCLYSDRKDRSILFWKSMPVSEQHNIAVKFLLGILAVNSVATVISWLVQLFALLCGMILANRAETDILTEVWSNIDLLKIFAQQIYLVFWFAIWWLPINAWMIFSSALARREPFLIAVLPVMGVILLEGLLFETHYIGQWIGEHFLINALKASSVLPIAISLDIYEDPAVVSSMGNMDLLLGFVITGLLLSATVWLRNHRFEL